MATVTNGARTPVSLWIVGILATLWNGFGAYDYLMTRLRNEDWIRSMMPGADPGAVFAWADAFPLYAQIAWPLGVWGGLAGAILLLLRSRFAVHAFALSLLGAVVGMAYQLFVAAPTPGPENAMTKVMPWIIIAIAIFLLWFASAMRKKGVLR
jgi:hypothetical protein